MELETKIDLFGALAILLFGSVLGGALTYQHMDQRLEDLENRVNEDRAPYLGNSSRISLTRLFEEVDPSVVSINSATGEPVQGSGFVYSEDGYIVTNQHVVENVEDIRVSFTDGNKVKGEVVGQDVYSDLAVIKVEKDDLEALELADSSKVREGHTAIAIGNPFGLSSSMTAGIISHRNRNLRVEGGFSIPNVLQTDAAINPGNSGGPLLNSKGEVVGVNTAIETRTGTFSGIGMAIPSNTVERAVPQIIEEGGYNHSWIGVSGHTVTPEIADAMNLSEEKGFMVVEVVEGGPAEEAGLKAGNRTVEIQRQEITVGGDVIVALNGEEVENIQDILNYLEQETEVGETIEVTVIRDGERIDIPLTLQSRPQD